MKPYKDIPNSSGMKCLFDVLSIEENLASNVVLRNITEDFWRKVIETTAVHRVCALGSPGVGKTTTTCILIRLLLEDKKTVVYRVRKCDKDGFIYMFTPSSDAVDVRVIREFEFHDSDTEVNIDSIYYIVDPGQTSDNCNLSGDYIGNVIIVASPDERHWKDYDFFKLRRRKTGTLLFFPVWTLQELVFASEYITEETDLILSENIIKERFNRFGGVPRYVFASMGNYTSQKNVQDLALADLSAGVAQSLVFKDRSAINSKSTNIPKGILLSYINAPHDCGTYRTGYAVFSSDYIYDYIVKKYMVNLWNQMIKNDAKFDPYLYEAYVRTLFYDNAKTPAAKKYKIRDLTLKNTDTERKNAISTETDINLGGCAGLLQSENIYESAVEKPMIVFHPYSLIFKLIDFVYRENGNPVVYNCFQCTIIKDHTATSDHIYDMANYIMNNNVNSASLPRINIFYAVPRHKYKDFITNPLNASGCARDVCMNRTGNESVLYLKWNEIVTIKVLCVDPPPDPAS